MKGVKKNRNNICPQLFGETTCRGTEGIFFVYFCMREKKAQYRMYLEVIVLMLSRICFLPSSSSDRTIPNLRNRVPKYVSRYELNCYFFKIDDDTRYPRYLNLISRLAKINRGIDLRLPLPMICVILTFYIDS